MNVRDLRVDNLVVQSLPFGSDKIKKLTIGDLALIEGKGSEEDYLAIPLTRNWLISFGFEHYGVVRVNEYESYSRWVLRNIIDGTSNFEVHVINSNYGGIESKEICFSIDNDERQYVKETSFVHNLQNCFYQCTGFELTHK